MATPLQPRKWDDFTAFAAPAALDSNILKSTTSVQYFYDWLDNLRETGNPNKPDCGIPPNRQEFVRDLLNKFFPTGKPSRKIAVRVSDEIENGQPVPKPVRVKFGPQDLDLQILDGPSALGYVFSVAKPTVAAYGWDNYFLPMLIIFARCLYLAYIASSPDGVASGKKNPDDVPWMSCVMYDPGVTPVPYMFGSTWTLDPANIANAQVSRESRQLMLDKWRRKTLLGLAVSHIPKPPDAMMPTIAPLWLLALAKEFYMDCVGGGVRGRLAVIPVDKASNMYETISVAFAAAYLQEQKEQKRKCLPVKEGELINVQKLQPTLLELSGKVLQFRFRQDFNPGNLEFLRAFQKFLQYYLVPHMFPVATTQPGTADVAKNEITAVPVAVQPVITAAMETMRATYAKELLTRLADFYADYEADAYARVIGFVPFGRCAETYPFGVMLPNYFPSINMNRIRGMAIENRPIGNSASSFDQTFSTDSISATVGNKIRGPWRFPCANCTSLLPIWKMAERQPPPVPVEKDDPPPSYDADLIRTPKKKPAW